MKKYQISILMVLLLAFPFPFVGQAWGAADPSANAKTQTVLQYLTNLPNGSTNKVISGQHNYYGASDTQIANIHSQTGKYVGLMGINYFWDNTTLGNNLIISWSNAGGLVTIYPAWINPAGLQSATEPIDPTPVDFVQLITPGTALNNTFKSYLDATAAGLQTLSNNNVVVLFRPFPEMSGGAFWWAGKTATQYKNAWIYVFNYLTQTKGLHNLLFVFAPNCYGSYMSYYPGAAYVDIVGSDTYPNNYPADLSGSWKTCYTNMLTLGKPFAMTEFGPSDGSGGDCASKDYSQLITAIKNQQPNTIYWMSWADKWSMDSSQACHHTGVSTLLNDSWVITREDIPTFTDTQFALSVTKASTGTVASSPSGINCGSTCSAGYTSGTVVTLTAAPDSGNSFTGWSGAGCSGTGPCVVTMNAAKTVTANFGTSAVSGHWRLFILKSNRVGAVAGNGTIASSPAGIDCGTLCQADYTDNTEVTLTATPDPGNSFTGWSGGGCSGTGACVVSANDDTSVTASFTSNSPSPSASGDSGGGGCFIATAAYGSYLDPHVYILRNFRDRYLLTNSLGQAFVDSYYIYSPPVAVFIGRHEALRAAARWALSPVVYCIEYPYFIALVLPVGVMVIYRRRKVKNN